MHAPRDGRHVRGQVLDARPLRRRLLHGDPGTDLMKLDSGRKILGQIVPFKFGQIVPFKFGQIVPFKFGQIVPFKFGPILPFNFGQIVHPETADKWAFDHFVPNSWVLRHKKARKTNIYQLTFGHFNFSA
jgi:hypothetical protein